MDVAKRKICAHVLAFEAVASSLYSTNVGLVTKYDASFLGTGDSINR
jgi:hypothetical protein